MKKKQDRTKMILILIAALITIGYALMQSDLNILGVTNITSASWNVEWTHIDVTEGSVTGSNVTTPATIDPNDSTTVNYNVTLTSPGKFYEFIVTAENTGSFDAMIDSISSKYNNVEITDPETDLPNYIEYSVTYDDDAEIAPYHLLEAGATEHYKVRVRYRDDAEPPATDQQLNFSFSVTYTQADDNAYPRPHYSYAYAGGTAQFVVGEGLPAAGDTYVDQNDAMEAYGHDICLSITLDSDVIVDISAGFLYNDEFFSLMGGQDESSDPEKFVYNSSKDLLLDVFGSSKCSTTSTSISCTDGGVTATANVNGTVTTQHSGKTCTVNTSGGRCN